MKGLNIALAALGGAIVGAAAALLLAPQEGKRTRSQIREFIREKCPFAHESQVDAIADQIEEEIKEKIDATLATSKKK
ncbi:MAG: YtxH domain-containing protein [Odoribacter sp.]|nr:YtxH domain-containing protein [Odoribacter sp.]